MKIKYDPEYEPRLFDADGDISKRWYIDFRIWDTDKQAFIRKQYTGMNKHKSKTARMKASLKVLNEIRDLIRSGYTAGTSTAVDEVNTKFDLKVFTLPQALTYFINYKNASTQDNELDRLEENYNQGIALISRNTFKNYKTLRTLVLEWLEFAKLPNLLLVRFNRQVCGLFFTYLKEKRGISNKTFNKYRGYFSTVLNFYVDNMELAIKNPVKKIEHLQAEESDIHEPFTFEHLTLIKNYLLEKGDRQMYLYISFLYYTFTRPDEEIRLLKVKEIRQRTLFIPADRAKNNDGAHISIPHGLEKLIQDFKLRDYSKDYYVFTATGVPGEKPVGMKYFYRKHKALLQELQLDGYGYTQYGYKHTGALTLYEQTKDILAVKNHCRHSNISQTDTYLRRYGAILNEKAILIREL